jgi:hypothetical protein
MKSLFSNVLKTIAAGSLATITIFVLNSAFTKIDTTAFPEYNKEMCGTAYLHHECSASSPFGGNCSATCQDECNCECNTTWSTCSCTCKCNGRGGNYTDIDPLSPTFEVITVSPKQYENWKAVYEILVSNNSPEFKASSYEWINIYNILKKKKPVDAMVISNQIENLLKSQSQEVRNKVNELMKKNNSSLRV